MSTTPLQEPRPRTRAGRRRLRWAILAVGAVLACLIGLYAYVEYANEREIQDAIAEADRLDPGWRFEDLEAARAAVPDAENSATLVLAAHALIPAKWPTPPANQTPDLQERLDAVPLPCRPPDALMMELRAELAQVAAALDNARPLADRPRGRYAITWSDDLIGTLVPHVFKAHEVARMLALDALRCSQDDSADSAMTACRAVLNAGRSLGDEPTGVSPIVRAACAVEAVRTLEHLLASGEASAKTLGVMQRALEEEATAPLLLLTARASQVTFFQCLDRMRTGRFDRATYKMRTSMLGSTFDDHVDASKARACEAAYLRHGTALVEIAKLPPESREERLMALAAPTQRLPALLEGLTASDGPAKRQWVNHARTFHTAQAELDCAAAALAAERYRLAEGRWPAGLDALVPHYLAALPRDPFDGQPLRFHPTADGLVIYSVGPDRVDNGGKVDRKQRGQPEADVGFRLWNPERRNVWGPE
jgi:hypothetical protein